MKDLHKIYSALLLPTDEKERIDYLALDAIIEEQIKDGVEGFYCCGSSGEALLMTLEERKQFLEAVLKKVDGRVPVISHIGTIRTHDVIELALHAKAAGADAVSMIPPYYYKFSLDELLSYYEDVLKAVPGLNVIVYNIPQFTGISFNKENAGRLLDNPNVIGIKHTCQDLYALERMRAEYPGKIYLNGFDEMFAPSLMAGADGTIGTTVNLFAPVFLAIRGAFLQGDNQKALRLQSVINERVETMVKAGIFNAVKYGWSAYRGIPCGTCRAPFKPLSSAQKELLDNMFRQIDFDSRRVQEVSL